MPDTTVITPFTLDVPQAELDDLRGRLSETRWPDAETVEDTSQGPRLEKVRALVEHWTTEYDWRRTEALLNGWGQHTTHIDGLEVHFLHVRSAVPGARALLLTHGWPGSVLEFRHAIGPLTDPVAHGGDAADAFHVVIPSLPGFGFSGRPTTAGWNTARTARAWSVLMSRLGYTDWFAQGGDLGATVTAELAALQASGDIGLAGIHLNMALFMPTDDEARNASPDEQVMLQESGHYWQELSAYSQQMSTRPQTIGYSLADSPVGLASWIYAMFQDVGGSHDEHGDAERIFPLDEIIRRHALLAAEHRCVLGADVLGSHPDRLGHPGHRRGTADPARRTEHHARRVRPPVAPLGGAPLHRPGVLQRGRARRALRDARTAGAAHRRRPGDVPEPALTPDGRHGASWHRASRPSRRALRTRPLRCPRVRAAPQSGEPSFTA
nr:epoxide hydrolase 1 [Curtobacterium flaccumfaciens]